MTRNAATDIVEVPVDVELFEQLRRLGEASNRLPYLPRTYAVDYVNRVLGEHVEAQAAKLAKFEAERARAELAEDRAASRRMEQALEAARTRGAA